MDRQFSMHYRSIVLSCLLVEAVWADIPCQDGITYRNSCNPYKVNFIHYTNRENTKANLKLSTKEQRKKEWFSRSYLNTLLDKYSKNYDGRSGLQALIDRSHYGINRKEEKKTETKEAKSIASSNIKVQKSTSKLQKATAQKEENSLELATQEHKTITAPIVKNVEKKETLKNKPSTLQKMKNLQHIAKVQKQEEKQAAKETKSKEKVKEAIASKQKSIKATVKKQKIATTLYKVQKGDTLSTIASTFGLSIKKLKKINNIGKDATIKIGESLKIPAHLAQKKREQEKLKAKKRAKEKKLLAKKRIQEQIKKGIYIVQKGDTLSGIAKKTKLSINQLREYNRIARSSSIKVGQKLLLKEPRIVKRKKGSLNYVKNIKFKQAPSLKFKRKIRVIATAYTSHRNQTDRTPFLAAWNNRIRPGMRIIAVSEDLIRKYGLKNGVKVKITGLPGYYVVRDKMNKRLRNHIDIYMGLNKRKALRWGRRRVALYW